MSLCESKIYVRKQAVYLLADDGRHADQPGIVDQLVGPIA